MKRFVKITVITAVILALGTAGTAFASSYKTPAEIVSALTGKTTDEVTSERADGKTYGTIANEAGQLDEFQSQMLEQKKAYLDQQVKDGTLTQERADEIYNAMKEAQLTCDGTGSASRGAGCGLGNGTGCGLGNGTGTGAGSCGMGSRLGGGAGRGMGGRFQR
ncbi:MAG: hypothetical protein H6Q59_2780 [Firmicutes bacterium]|nr:hypothetical protein [Bacillota bacterium]